MTTLPNKESKDILRYVELPMGHKLLLWDTNKRFSTGQYQLGYAFYAQGFKTPLFVGDDYGCAPSYAVDSDKCIIGLLAFLALEPGDTDDDYFEDYNEEQLAWCNSDDVEELHLLVIDAESDSAEAYYVWNSEGDLCTPEGLRVFKNLPGYKFCEPYDN